MIADTMVYKEDFDLPQDEHITLETLTADAFVPKPSHADLAAEQQLLDDVARLNIQSSHDAIREHDEAAQ